MSVKELVQQQRDELYVTGHRNLRMSLSEDVITQLDVLKKNYGLRSRDAVVARIIRKAKASVAPKDYVQRPAADPDMTYRWISPIVAVELSDYVKDIQRCFRGLNYGPVFEMIFAVVGDDLSSSIIG